MPTLVEPKLISGNSNLPLANAIARRMSLYRGMKVGLVDARVERFNDQEIFVEVYENVRGEDMFIMQSTSNPANDNLMELLIMADALRRSSAARITAVIPYFGYARQDRRTKARTPITAKLVANMIAEAGIERVLTMDLHATQIQGFFDMPVDNLYASPVFALDIQNQFADMENVMVVSPDVGGVARARELAKRINAPLSIVDKRREQAGVVAEMTVIGDVSGKRCIIVDDICDTAGTLCKAAEVLMENGASEVHSYITHGVLSGPAVERITNSVMKSLVISDSIKPPKRCAMRPTSASCRWRRCWVRPSSTSGTAPRCRRCSRPRPCGRSTKASSDVPTRRLHRFSGHEETPQGPSALRRFRCDQARDQSAGCFGRQADVGADGDHVGEQLGRVVHRPGLVLEGLPRLAIGCVGLLDERLVGGLVHVRARHARSASTETPSPISAKPPVTTNSSLPLSVSTRSTPGRSVVISGAWFGIAVRSPSAPGIDTDTTCADIRLRSGLTRSNCMVSAIWASC